MGINEKPRIFKKDIMDKIQLAEALMVVKQRRGEIKINCIKYIEIIP